MQYISVRAMTCTRGTPEAGGAPAENSLSSLASGAAVSSAGIGEVEQEVDFVESDGSGKLTQHRHQR